MVRMARGLAARLSLLVCSIATASACDALQINVDGDAMAPTLKDGESAIATRTFDTLDRGDVVGFRYPRDATRSFVMRIVGLPGERVEIQNGQVLIDGRLLEEPYVADGNRSSDTWGPIAIPEGEYFVMGDNRSDSVDSRSWGTVGRPAIWAKVMLADESEQEPRMTVQRVSSADGVPIAYEVHGDGRPALVFVHGWSCDRTYWSGQIEPFSRDFTVVAVDLAGHGESGVDRRSWTMASFGEDVAAVVTELDLQDVILIGHSMGGDVVPEAARRLPGRVSGLIWVDAYKQLGPGRTPEQVEELLATFRPDFAGRTGTLVRSMFVPASDPALVDRVATDMASAPPDIAIAALESAFSYSREVTRTLAALKLPVVAINPDDAPTDTESMTRAGVEVMIMPGVGHFLQLEDAERFNALLRVGVDKMRR